MRGIPFYLLVPRGLKEVGTEADAGQAITVSCVYEYTFINGVCHIFEGRGPAPQQAVMLAVQPAGSDQEYGRSSYTE